MQENELTKRKNGLKTYRRLLDASAELFAKNGYNGVTMRKIAEKIGIKESSIYNHFKSKSLLLDALFDTFVAQIPKTRPTEEEINGMLMIMEAEEIFKSILFYVGKNVNGLLANIALIIHYEKHRNLRAAEMYYKYIVNEPAEYYEKLITKMIKLNLIRQIDARIFAEQYNYVSIALTKEFIMAQHGLADTYKVVEYMVKTIKFFCRLMQ